MKPRWQAGDQIVLREVWRGKVWSARPEIVVLDASDMLLLYLPAGTRRRIARIRGIDRLKFPPSLDSEWDLIGSRRRWAANRLALVTPGASSATELLWSEDFSALRC